MTASVPQQASATARGLVPTRTDLTDLALAVGLVTLGVVGFDSAFGGDEAYIVGLPAVLAGAVVGYLVAKLRPPILVGAAAGIVAFFLLGGAIALRGDALGGALPSADVLSGLVDGTVNGWARLITTVPPAGQAGNLLAIPYLAGFAGAFLTVVAALLVRRWPVCVAPPVVVLALSVLFGVKEPASLLLQGGLFGMITIGWLTLRVDRTNRPAVLHPSHTRLAGSVGLLVVGMLGAFAVGPRLPFAGANDRYVLREHVQPPFDPSQYPSPLGRFRKFHGPEGTVLAADTVLFTVEHLPAGHAVRLAVMDAYDGFVWRASEAGSSIGGTYLRVGDHIPGARAGEPASARFTMGELTARDAARDFVWIPTFGSPTGIGFGGPNADALRESFRFNRVTDTAASPRPLAKGDEWTVDANVADRPSDEELATLPAASIEVTAPAGYQDNEDLVQLAQEWAGEASAPYEQVVSLSQNLAAVGAVNDGDADHPIASGHSLARLSSFLLMSQPQGNDEQFAAGVAFLASGLGIPTRVVLVAQPRGTGAVEVHPDDIRAVVEVALEGAGWVALPPIEPQNDPTKQAAKDQPKLDEPVQPPPPTTIAPPNTVPDEPDEQAPDIDASSGKDSSVARMLGVIVGVIKVVSIPLIVIFGPALVVIGLKARRRSRRRTTGPAAARIAGGWNEVIDLARDLGTPVPPKATRREIGRFAAVGSVATLAEEVDAAVFGHADPQDADAEALWNRVDEARAEMLAGKSRAERIRANVSLTSLRGTR